MDGDRDVPSERDGDRGSPAETGAGSGTGGAPDTGGDGPGETSVEEDRGEVAGDGDRSSDSAHDGDPVELGVQLLARLEHPELELPEVIDRIETVTTDPQTTRAILETAEARGHIAREGATVRPSGGRFLRFESEVVSREGEFDCRRCGASISTGYFMRLEAGEHGPFGSSCIRKVTGRE